MPVTRIPMTVVFAMLVAITAASTCDGGFGGCDLAADHALLQAKSDMFSSKKLAAKAKPSQPNDKDEIEPDIDGKAGADGASPTYVDVDHALKPNSSSMLNTGILNEVFEKECQLDNAMNDASVLGVYTIMGGLHESLIIHIKNPRPPFSELAVMTEFGVYTGPETQNDNLNPSHRPWMLIRCESMPWMGDADNDYTWTQYGSCMSELGYLGWARAFLGDSMKGLTPCIGSTECPCDNIQPKRSGTWYMRNAMQRSTFRRTIQPMYSTYGAVVKAIREYSETHVPSNKPMFHPVFHNSWFHQSAEASEYDFLKNNCQDYASTMFSMFTGDKVSKDSDCKIAIRTTKDCQ